VALAQYSIRVGLKKFKTKGKLAVMKELMQMHDMNVFTLIYKHSLTKKEGKGIGIANISKGKMRQNNKGMHVCRWMKERGDWTKQESTSPTLSTKDHGCSRCP
jgi:hypothetical protein